MTMCDSLHVILAAGKAVMWNHVTKIGNWSPVTDLGDLMLVTKPM